MLRPFSAFETLQIEVSQPTQKGVS